MKRADFVKLVDHTILAPQAGVEQVRAAASDAVTAGCASVCVNSARVATVAPLLVYSDVKLCTVIGFPFGSVLTDAKVAEARAATQDGANEFDMVLNIGSLIDGDTRAVERDISAVHAVIPLGALLKVILETSALSPPQIVAACLASEAAGADFVKTSTGFHPSGGATTEAVRLMRKTVPNLGVKASGGIRTLATAQEMLDAGASRLGMSATLAVLDELND
jgi:deoxyribose-phosphate aldolase